MKKFTAGSIILILFVTGCSLDTRNKEFRFGKKGPPVSAEKHTPEQSRLPVSTLSNTVDVHYSAKYCTECHLSAAPSSGKNSLKFGGNFKQLCRCHYNTSNSYVHPVDRKPSPEMIAAIPAQFPLRDGQITCSTCHDIVLQCRDNQLERTFLKDQKFLRDGPFQTKFNICYRCHNIK